MSCKFDDVDFSATGCSSGSSTSMAGIIPITSNCSTTCNSPAECIAENNFIGLSSALNLHNFDIDWTGGTGGAVSWTSDDYHFAYRYAVRRLCVKFGFRLRQNMGACDGKESCLTTPASIESAYPTFCGFTARQCSVASTSVVDKGESCMYGVYDFGGGGKCMERSWGSIAGAFGSAFLAPFAQVLPGGNFISREGEKLTNELVDKYITDRFKGVSSGQLIHSTDGPEYCHAISKQGASVQHTKCESSSKCIAGSRLKDMCLVSPWCDYNGMCAGGSDICASDSDCGRCTGSNMPCSVNDNCPDMEVTTRSVSGPYTISPGTCKVLNSRASIKVDSSTVKKECTTSGRICKVSSDCTHCGGDSSKNACISPCGTEDCIQPEDENCNDVCPASSVRRKFNSITLAVCTSEDDCVDKCVAVPPCAPGFTTARLTPDGKPCPRDGDCLEWCVSCSEPSTCQKIKCDFSDAKCKARKFARMTYSSLPQSALPTGPIVKRELFGVNNERECKGTNPLEGTAVWDANKCHLVGQVDGGPAASVDVPVVGGASYGSGTSAGTGQSTDCDEIGGIFDVSSVTCKVPPFPPVTHECVYPYGLSDGSAAKRNMDVAMSANALTADQYATGQKKCEAVGGSLLAGVGCRVTMPVVKPSELWTAYYKGGSDGVHKKVNDNRTQCESKGGTYKTYPVGYSEWKQVYNDGTYTQHDCSPVQSYPRTYCETPTVRVNATTGKPITGMWDSPAWVYNAYGTDPALGGQTTCKKTNLITSYTSSVVDKGVSSCQWLQDAFELSSPDTQDTGDATVSAEWTTTEGQRKDWMCHASQAYCNKKEVDFGGNPMSSSLEGGCYLKAQQAFFENIFGKTMVRNFRRDIIENSESAYHSCSKNKGDAGSQIAGSLCAAGAALAGSFEWAGDGIVDLGKSIGDGFKDIGHWMGISDLRLKRILMPLAADVLGKDVHIYLYTWNDKAKKLGIALGQNTTVGFVAQEVQTVFPDLVRARKNGFLYVDIPTLDTAKKDRRLGLLRHFMLNGSVYARSIDIAFETHNRDPLIGAIKPNGRKYHSSNA